jgi:hypothetical protein
LSDSNNAEKEKKEDKGIRVLNRHRLILEYLGEASLNKILNYLQVR